MLLTGLTEWPTLTPEQAKVALDAMPEGKRTIFWWHAYQTLYAMDTITGSNGVQYRSIWPTNGIAWWKNYTETWFSQFHAIGGKFKRLYQDYEDGIGMWNGIRADGAAAAPEEYAVYTQAIMADPRFPEIAAQIGFSDISNIFDFRGHPDYTVWNAVMSARRDQHMNEAIFDVVKKYFPDVEGWCDASTTIRPSQWSRDFNGHKGWSWLNQDDSDESAGKGYATHDTIYLFNGYGENLAIHTDVTGDGLPLGDGAFKALLFMMEGVRAKLRSTNRPWVPLMAYEHFSYNYAGDLTQSNVHGTPYYQEVVFHALLTGADIIEYWNPSSGAAGLFPPDPTDPNYPVFMEDAQKLHSIVVEAQSHIPYRGTCTTLERVNYRSTEFRTSYKMQNGQTISRVTYSQPDSSGSFGHWE